MAVLGDTLFPATSLRASLLQDFASNTPALLRFRPLHPSLAVVAGFYVIWVVLTNSSRRMHQSRTSRALIILLFTEFGDWPPERLPTHPRLISRSCIYL